MNVTNEFLDDFIKTTPSCEELTLVSFLSLVLLWVIRFMHGATDFISFFQENVGYQVYAWGHRIIVATFAGVKLLIMKSE